MNPQDLLFLKRAIDLAAKARTRGNHPFGAVLVNSFGRVIFEAENTVITTHDPTAHAETNLLRSASRVINSETLRTSTLYCSTEPCAMCSGATVWSGVGRVVYALGEEEMYRLAGEPDQNAALMLPCRRIFAQCSYPILVEGPATELAEEAMQVHRGYWHN